MAEYKYDNILVQIRDGIATVIMNRPDKAQRDEPGSSLRHGRRAACASNTMKT